MLLCQCISKIPPNSFNGLFQLFLQLSFECLEFKHRILEKIVINIINVSTNRILHAKFLLSFSTLCGCAKPSFFMTLFQLRFVLAKNEHVAMASARKWIWRSVYICLQLGDVRLQGTNLGCFTLLNPTTNCWSVWKSLSLLLIQLMLFVYRMCNVI